MLPPIPAPPPTINAPVVAVVASCIYVNVKLPARIGSKIVSLSIDIAVPAGSLRTLLKNFHVLSELSRTIPLC